MKKVKQMNGYTIMEYTAKDEKQGHTIGEHAIYFTSDIKEYGLAASEPEFEDITTLDECMELCSNNYANAKAIAEENTTCVSVNEIEAVETLLDSGMSEEETEENYQLVEIVETVKALGYDINIRKVNKNGIIKTGITFNTKNSNIAPCIYVDSLLNDNLTTDEIVEKLIYTYKNSNTTQDFKLNDILTADYVYNNCFLRLGRKSGDTDLVTVDFHDLELYVAVKVESNLQGVSSFKVTNNIYDSLNLDMDTLFRKAQENTRQTAHIEDMAQMLADMMGVSVEEVGIPSSEIMVVVTNKDKLNGASVIADGSTLKNIAERYNSDLMIIPSSVHEVIIRLYDGGDISEYNSMVNEVNNAEVAPEEQLSNHCYIFRKNTCTIEY